MAEVWGFILVLVFLLWVSYEVDKSKKARGEPGIPFLGHVFDSVTFNFREEVLDGDDAGNKDKKPTTSVSKEPVPGSPKKRHHHHHKHNKKRSNRTSTANKKSHHKKHKSKAMKDEVKSADQQAPASAAEPNE